jgi:general secretion pathway protein E
VGSHEPETPPFLSIDDLGLLPHSREAIERIARSPFGIILIAGPPGNGRATTIAASLRFLAERGRRAAVSRPEALRPQPVLPRGGSGGSRPSTDSSDMGSDPGALAAGEIADGETADVAVHAALTGRLVLGIIRAADAATAIVRLTDLGIPPFLASSAMAGVVAQRLVRRTCHGCRAAGTGCADCGGTGFQGKAALFEVLPIDDPLRLLIGEGAPAGALRREARKRGIPALRDDGATKVLRGITTAEEVRRAIEDPRDQGCGL